MIFPTIRSAIAAVAAVAGSGCVDQVCRAAPPAGQPVVFRFATTEPASRIDPRAVTGPSRGLAINLFQGLVEVGPDGRVDMVGAESVQVSPDGSRYRFFLRPEVKWSDGAPVTARDYQFAYQTALSPAFASETARILYPLRNAEAYNSGKIASADQLGVNPVDDTTLEVTLERPSLQLLETMATAYVFMPVPRHVVERFGDAWTEASHIVTNGPYTMSEWTHNGRVVLKRNPHYFRARPYIDEVRITLLADPTAQDLTMYEAGDLDYANVSSSDLSRVKADPTLSAELHTARIPRMYGLFLDHRGPPFDDKRVRQALYLAIWREALGTISRGQLVPLYSPIPHTVPGHRDDIRLSGDSTRARALLAEAGYPGGRGFPQQTLVIRSSAVEILQAQAIQAMLRQILGLDLKVEQLEPSAFRSFIEAARGGRSFDILMATATADSPDPSLYHNLLIGENGEGYYPTHWRNPNYNRLLRASLEEIDVEKRLELYRQMDQLVVDDVGFVPVSTENLQFVVSPAFEGVYIAFGDRDPTVWRAVAGKGGSCHQAVNQ